MDSICGGFVAIQRGTYRIIQFRPREWNVGSFGIWDGGGDELILTLMEYSKYSDTIFMVFKHDGLVPEALKIFMGVTHPENVVYVTPSVHASIRSVLPPNILVLYSAWRASYIPYTPAVPSVPHTIQKVCFRGQGFPVRQRLSDAFASHPRVDFKITLGSWHPEFKKDPHLLTHEEQRKYRGLVSVEGGCGHPSNLVWVLGSGCVPVVHCDFHTGLQMDMKPWVHYVPLTDAGVNWIFDNPEKADEVIRNALQLHKRIRYNVHKQLSGI